MLESTAFVIDKRIHLNNNIIFVFLIFTIVYRSYPGPEAAARVAACVCVAWHPAQDPNYLH